MHSIDYLAPSGQKKYCNVVCKCSSAPHNFYKQRDVEMSSKLGCLVIKDAERNLSCLIAMNFSREKFIVFSNQLVT